MTTNTSTKTEGEGGFNYYNAVPVLDYEINSVSEIFKEDPDNRYSPKVAVLPTGACASRIHYVGYVGQKRISETDEGDTKAHIRCSEANSTVNIFSNSRFSSVTQQLVDIDRCTYISVIAKLFLTESQEGDTLVGVTPEVVNEVDERVRERFLFTAAEESIDRILSLSEGAETEEQKMAAEHYGVDNLNQYANAVQTAVKAGYDLRKRRVN